MFCEKCGAELLEDAAFCEKCGAPVDAAGKSPVHAQTPTYSRTAPKKKTGIVLVIALLALAAVAALSFSGIMGGKGPDGNASDAISSQAILASKKPEAQSKPEQPAAESPVTDGLLDAGGESLQLSTTEAPTAEDFQWFTAKSERWVYGITPADAYLLEDFYALLGSWKGLQIIYDYDGTVLGHGYFTVTLNESGPIVAATLHWHYIDWADGSHEDLTGREDEGMTGSFFAPTLALGEAGNRIELIIYAMDGKQYAEGVWTVHSGEEVRIALVRP